MERKEGRPIDGKPIPDTGYTKVCFCGNRIDLKPELIGCTRDLRIVETCMRCHKSAKPLRDRDQLMENKRKDKAYVWSELWQKTQKTEPRFYSDAKKWCIAVVSPSGDLEFTLPKLNKPTLNRDEALKLAEWINDLFK